jgi:hypothetical protein
MLSRHTTHEQKNPPEASMSQANQFANNTHEEFMFNSPVAEEGVNNLQVSMTSKNGRMEPKQT